jgi:hypothetical protein
MIQIIKARDFKEEVKKTLQEGNLEDIASLIKERKIREGDLWKVPYAHTVRSFERSSESYSKDELFLIESDVSLPSAEYKIIGSNDSISIENFLRLSEGTLEIGRVYDSKFVRPAMHSFGSLVIGEGCLMPTPEKIITPIISDYLASRVRYRNNGLILTPEAINLYHDAVIETLNESGFEEVGK